MAMYKIIGGDKQVYGPVAEEELRRWVAEGRLNAQSLIQPEGATEWQPLSSFPEFAEALRSHVAPPPLPSAPALPVNAEALTAEMLAREPYLNIGQCLSQSWQLLTANFGLLFGATFVVWIVGAICEPIPVVHWGYLLIKGALYGGLSLLFLRRIRGQPAALGDVFAGFKDSFLQFMLAGIVSALLSQLGLCLCILPGLYLFVAWTFSLPLVGDKRLEFWSAMELSRKVVNRVWFQLFGLIILAFLPMLLVTLYARFRTSLAISPLIQEMFNSGQLDLPHLLNILLQLFKAGLRYWVLTKVVFLLNLPFGVGALMYAYEALFGARRASAP